MTVGSPCPTCGGGNPLDGDDPVCQCGSLWAVDDVDWDQVLHMLVVRSGQRCEARTPWCYGKPFAKGSVAGWLGDLSRGQVSIHHRRPRGMGGTDRRDVHSLANLMLLCGSGTIGCHGFIESHRDVARERGYLVPQGHDPAAVPVTLPNGRLVVLDATAPFYLDTGRWDRQVPDWPAAA